MQQLTRCSNAVQPDLVFLTGDLVDHNPHTIWELIPFLERLRARYGVFAVLGNHDYKPARRPSAWLKSLECGLMEFT